MLGSPSSPPLPTRPPRPPPSPHVQTQPQRRRSPGHHSRRRRGPCRRASHAATTARAVLRPGRAGDASDVSSGSRGSGLTTANFGRALPPVTTSITILVVSPASPPPFATTTATALGTRRIGRRTKFSSRSSTRRQPCVFRVGVCGAGEAKDRSARPKLNSQLANYRPAAPYADAPVLPPPRR